DIILLDTPEEATPIYKKFFWDAMKLDGYPSGVDFLMFDFGVNSGPANAKKILQRSLNRQGANLEVDGVVGPKTMAMMSKINTEFIVSAMLKERDIFYRKIVANDHSHEANLQGWLNRVAKLTVDVRSFV
ncbi:MAG: secretion activating protein, partial [Nanoarchaeota archaeon]|nr:secretion activating protein [Nanoarchaeota archaeon]